MPKNIVAVIGGGGRESALLEAYLRSDHVAGAIAIPGNGAMKHWESKPVEVFVDIETKNAAKILELCRLHKVSLVDVSQDNAVQAGVTNYLRDSGFKVIGATKEAGKIEWSKSWSRVVCEQLGFLQPGFKIFNTERDGIAFIEAIPEMPLVIKADGPRRGKGVVTTYTKAQAIAAIKNMGASRYLVEQWLMLENNVAAEEFSAFAMIDRNIVKNIGYAQDYKRVDDGEKGDMTGSMGCNNPALVLTENQRKEVQEIFQKLADHLVSIGRPYSGVLYLGGILIPKDGKMRVYIVEFNARWGDTEAQVLVPRMKTDMFELSMAVAEGRLHEVNILNDSKSRVALTGAALGYPGPYKQAVGKEVFGLDRARMLDDVSVFGAGICVENDRYFVSGETGRLFQVVGEGYDLIEAHANAYKAMSLISVEGGNLYFREKIGWRDLERLRR